jgi:APA family basic amino acid/polyamine antiporter
MTPSTLPRRLGLLSTVGVLIGIVIGSGIFRVPAIVAAEVGSAGAAMLIWVVGGLFTLSGALTLAELAGRYPQPGGAYVFIREAYGPLVAFLFAWVKLLMAGPSAVAAVALIFAAYAGAFVPLTDVQQRIVAGGLLLVLALLNLRSVAWSAMVQNLSTATKLLALTMLAVLLLSFGGGSGALAEPVGWAPSSWGGFGVALITVLWTYTGWVDVTYLAGEVTDPVRTFPRAMAGGLITVILVYLLINVAYLYVLPLGDLAQSDTVAATAAGRVFGTAGTALVSALVMVSTLGSLNGTFLTSPRVFYKMAGEGLFFRSVGAVHPRYRTPYMAVLLYLVLGVLGISTRTFEQLAQMFVLGSWPFYALAVGAVFVLPRRDSAGVPVRRSWGYPGLPAVFLLLSLAMLINGAIRRPTQTGVSFLILFSGVPAYYAWRAVEARRVRAGTAEG